MKKYLFVILALCFCCYSYCEVLKYRATDVSYKYKNDYGYWTDWSKWEKNNILIVINSDKDVVTIYSSETQEFDIVEYLGETTDNDGGTSVKFLCVDKDGGRNHMRIRMINGGWQLYIDYSDFMYVYSIEPR